MSKIFVKPSVDVIRTELPLDYSGEYARPVILPDKTLLMSVLGNMPLNEKEDAWEKMQTRYNERVKSPDVKTEWMLWRRWDLSLRRKIEGEAEIRNNVTGDSRLDATRINDGKLRYLLKDWSFCDDNGNKVALKHDNDVLTPESFEMAKSIESNLLLAFFSLLDESLYMTSEESKNSEPGLPQVTAPQAATTT